MMQPKTVEIMVVDDDNTFRESAAEALEEELGGMDVKVIQACNGLEASLYAQNGMIIFLDLEMPEMDGYRFMGAIKERGIRPAKIVVTGSQAGEMNQTGRIARQKVRDSYSNPEDIMYLPKPIELCSLVSTAISLIEGRQDCQL